MQLRDSEAARKTGIEVFYYVFDLLYLDGYALDALPLRQRKNLLEKALSFGGPLSFSAHRDMDGEAYYAEACAKGWEGVIAKRADSAYVHHRSADWLKFKCSNEQELVIGGFTDPRGSRIGFGALLTGYYKNGRLQYAGKVGTGYNTQTLMDLRKQLRALEQHRSPFVQRISEHGVHWVRPELVAQIAFAEWTRDGRLRQARFRGLRRDKTPHSVVAPATDATRPGLFATPA